jgi:hypothetical protein
LPVWASAGSAEAPSAAAEIEIIAERFMLVLSCNEGEPSLQKESSC